MNISIKKIIGISIGVALVAVAIWIVVRYLTTGVVRIETHADAQISYFEIVENEKQSHAIGSGPTASERLEPGVYTVSATTSEDETRTTVTVEARQTTETELSITESNTPEEVTFGGAYNIVADEGEFRFLDKNLQQVYELASPDQRPVSIFSELPLITNMAWANYDSAFVELDNNAYRIIVNNSVEPFQYPQEAEPEADFVPSIPSYSVNDRGQMAANIEGGLYMYPGLENSPEKLRDLQSSNMRVELSSTGNVFAFHPPATAESAATEIANELTGFSDARLPETIKNTAVLNAEWSPSGALLAVAMKDSLYMYNTSDQQLERIMKFVPDNTGSLTWSDENVLFMLDDGAIWQMDVGNKKWHKIANTPDPVRHSNALTVSEDGSTLYFGTTSQGLQNSGSLYSLELHR